MHYQDMEGYDPEADYFDLPTIDELLKMWRDLPQDIKDHIQTHAKNLFNVYGPMLQALVVQAYRKMKQRKIAVVPALHLAAKQLNIPPRKAGPGHPGKLTQSQVKQRQQRINQRLPSSRAKLSYKTRGY
jgi:hypothetical protein